MPRKTLKKPAPTTSTDPTQTPTHDPHPGLPDFLKRKVIPVGAVTPAEKAPVQDEPEPAAVYAGPEDATAIIPPDPPQMAVFEDLPPVTEAMPSPVADTFIPLGEAAASVVAKSAVASTKVPEKSKDIRTPLPPAAQATSVNASTKRYVQRVEVVDAYCFDGPVAYAPSWIDRNWIAYDNTPGSQGPTLAVPDASPTGSPGIAKRGDYIVRQSLLMDEMGARTMRIAIYTKDEFEKFFLSLPDPDAPKAKK